MQYPNLVEDESGEEEMVEVSTINENEKLRSTITPTINTNEGGEPKKKRFRRKVAYRFESTNWLNEPLNEPFCREKLKKMEFLCRQRHQDKTKYSKSKYRKA